MILSNECWMKDRCKKGLSNNECIENDIFCKKLFKLEYLYQTSLLPMGRWKHEDLHLEQSRVDEESFIYLSEVQKNIDKFVSNGDNLFIHSDITGNGKTAWAIRLIQTYLNSIWYKCDLTCKALFINVPKYLLAIKDNISQYNDYAIKIKDNVLVADLVVWDDIGTKVATSFEHENLLSIIDYRINESKSNIFTSNLSPADIKDFMGDRLYSRIINCSTVIQFFGQDKRNLRTV